MQRSRLDELTENGELFKVLQQHEGTGLDFESLYRLCKTYAERVELSKDLRVLVDGRVIKKDGKLYRYEDPTKEIKKLLGVPEDPPPPPPPPPRVVRVAPRPKPEPTPAPEEPRTELPRLAPMGDLRRAPALTPVALVLYYADGREMTIEEIQRRANVGTYQSAYAALANLVKREYVDRSGEGRGDLRFRWGSKYRYPFSSVKPEDASWREVKIIQAVEVPPPVEVEDRSKARADTPDNVIPIGDHGVVGSSPLSTIDSMIERLEAELAALRIARNLMAGTQSAAIA